MLAVHCNEHIKQLHLQTLVTHAVGVMQVTAGVSTLEDANRRYFRSHFIIIDDRQPNASCSMACLPSQRNSDLRDLLDKSSS
jgi:hypothetical protein